MKNVTVSHLLIDPVADREQAKKYIQKTWNINVNTYHHLAWFEDEGALKIATVRELKEHLGFAQNSKNIRFCIVMGIDTATVPAQNALLKVIEEPPENTQLVLVGSTLSTVLPTIQSRCIVSISNTSTPYSQKVSQATEELYTTITSEKSISTALTTAESFTDRAEALLLATELKHLLHQKIKADSTNQVIPKHLRAVLQLQHQLQHNCNVQLVVEALFLHFIEE